MEVSEMKTYPFPKFTQNKQVYPEYAVFDEVIDQHNVKLMGELLALKVVRRAALYCGKYYSNMYRCLLRDIFKSNCKDHVFSDGYDYAQEGVLFLLPFIGKKITDFHSVDKRGNAITIKTACSRYLECMMMRNRKVAKNTDFIEDLYVEPSYKPTKEFDEEQKNVEKTIRKMKLKKGEKDVLNCYIAGMTFVQIARFLKIDYSTVWKRRKRLQIKYNSNIK